MIRLEKTLKREKQRLNRIIENSDGNLIQDLILAQSRRVDELIVAYQRIKQKSVENTELRLVSNDFW